ncbi:hypothetical protein [Okeania sp. SIO2C9]|nr:hypothetical protein [Okeania sp. SIO2C9]
MDSLSEYIEKHPQEAQRLVGRALSPVKTTNNIMSEGNRLCKS